MKGSLMLPCCCSTLEGHTPWPTVQDCRPGLNLNLFFLFTALVVECFNCQNSPVTTEALQSSLETPHKSPSASAASKVFHKVLSFQAAKNFWAPLLIYLAAKADSLVHLSLYPSHDGCARSRGAQQSKTPMCSEWQELWRHFWCTPQVAKATKSKHKLLCCWPSSTSALE